MSESFTNEDFLAALTEAQDSARRSGPSFGEYRQDLGKSRPSGVPISPGFGLMGSLGTSSRAPTGPNYRNSGNQAVGFRGDGPSKYQTARPNQPLPWIEDVDMANSWYSPMEPVWPFGPPNITTPREWNYPVGYNLNFVPQRLEQVGMLRGMRHSWGILATVIQTRKDQLLRLPWTIQVCNKPRAQSAAVDEIRSFLRKPDGKMTFNQWTRRLLDDLFVIDAPSIFMDRSLDGKLRNAQLLDGGSIFPLIDDAGRRPDTDAVISSDGIDYIHRQPAFQQIIYGLPMVNLSEDELMYAMMNPLPELPVFGYSPVQQILTEATEAIRKTFYQLEFWRAGSMPELIVTVPDNWTPRQIATFQAHFDAVLSGQLTLKSKVRFVPGGMKPFDIKNASGQSLWSERDELLVRLCCYAFSVAPTPFIKQVNRSVANQSQETAQEEGLMPLMSWWKDDIMDTIIQEKLGFSDVEFVFLPRPMTDQSKQSIVYDTKVKEGAMSRNEWRAADGLEAIPDGDVFTVTTGAGVFRLDQIVSGEAMMPGVASDGGKDAEGAPKKPAPTAVSASPIRGAARPREASVLPPAPVKKLSGADIAHIARETNSKPNKFQRKFGNYKKGKFSYRGLLISIENAKGSKRADRKMPAAYGYIRRTLGADDMQVDCYLGKYPESPTAWVVDQDKFDSAGADKGFDEHKVMLAFKSAKNAIKTYLRAHNDGLGAEKLSSLVQLNYDELKAWLKEGDMKRPISEQGYGHVVARRGVGGGITKADTINQSTGLLWHSLDGGKKTRRKAKKKLRRDSGPKWLTLCA